MAEIEIKIWLTEEETEKNADLLYILSELEKALIESGVEYEYKTKREEIKR